MNRLCGQSDRETCLKELFAYCEEKEFQAGRRNWKSSWKNCWKNVKAAQCEEWTGGTSYEDD